MQLLTKALERRFAQAGRQDNSADPVVIAKFFNPAGTGTWYATEYVPEERAFIGLADLLDELEGCQGRIGLGWASSVTAISANARFPRPADRRKVPEAVRAPGQRTDSRGAVG
jgi:hypothetical protein